MTVDSRPVLFVDIDNTLYSKNKNIAKLMGELINKYFMTHLSLSEEDAEHLHLKYYQDYGLAIEGLVRHHKVDPLEYNSKVDDALPLEDVLSPDIKLRNLIQSFDKNKVRLWLFTNAYINHGKRVVKLLGVDDLFDGITYCDYSAQKFICKPNAEMFDLAMNDAHVDTAGNCYFIDDSALNCRAANDLGWTTVHLVENEQDIPAEQAGTYQINSLYELPNIFPDFFKSDYNDHRANGTISEESRN